MRQRHAQPIDRGLQRKSVVIEARAFGLQPTQSRGLEPDRPIVGRTGDPQQRQTRKIGLGQLSLRGREYLVSLKPCGKGLVLETLRAARDRSAEMAADARAEG